MFEVSVENANTKKINRLICEVDWLIKLAVREQKPRCWCPEVPSSCNCHCLPIKKWHRELCYIKNMACEEGKNFVCWVTESIHPVPFQAPPLSKWTPLYIPRSSTKSFGENMCACDFFSHCRKIFNKGWKVGGKHTGSNVELDPGSAVPRIPSFFVAVLNQNISACRPTNSSNLLNTFTSFGPPPSRGFLRILLKWPTDTQAGCHKRALPKPSPVVRGLKNKVVGFMTKGSAQRFAEWKKIRSPPWGKRVDP